MRFKALARTVTAAGLAAAATAVVLTSAFAGPPTSASMVFGAERGSDRNDPANGIILDQSLHAVDHVYPRTVVISRGGTVDIDVRGFHQVAICGAGDTLRDVTVPAFPPSLLVNDADCPAAAPLFADVSRTFNEAGRYLVLCNITPHLQLGMYGWVEVK